MICLSLIYISSKFKINSLSLLVKMIFTCFKYYMWPGFDSRLPSTNLCNNIPSLWLYKIGSFIQYIFIDYYTCWDRMGYAVVINSLTLSGCTPQVYFPVLQIRSGFGQLSRTAVLHVYTQHSRLLQTFGTSTWTWDSKIITQGVKRELKRQESIVKCSHLAVT